MTKTLSREQARRVYDRIGSLQDSQAFYEDRAVGLLVEHGRFAEAGSVFELGCGTGRLALRLLSGELPEGASYRAVDLSPTMVGLATERLAGYAPRATVQLSNGDPPTAEPDAGFDRFVSTYVLDLLEESEIDAVLREAHRMLRPGGLLCLASLGKGTRLASRALVAVWAALHRISPAMVGGCRPLDLLARLPRDRWAVRHHGRVVSFAVPSEVIVAERV